MYFSFTFKLNWSHSVLRQTSMKVVESLQYFQMQGNNSIVLQKYYMFLEMVTDCDFFSDLIGMPLPLLFHFA